MASQQSARRVTRGTAKRQTADSNATTPTRRQTSMDDHVLVLPENATPPMDFGTDHHSDEECASALDQPHTDRLDLHQTRSYPPDESEVENSDEEHANLDDDQGHLLSTPAEGHPLLLHSTGGLAGADPEFSAPSGGEGNITTVDVATRETIQRPPAAGSQQPPRLLTQSVDRRGGTSTATRRWPITTNAVQRANTHADSELLPDDDGSPQPPASARGQSREPEQPRPPAAVGSAARGATDETRREQPQPPAAPGSAFRQGEVCYEVPQLPARSSAFHPPYSDVRREQPQPPAAPGPAHARVYVEQPQPPAAVDSVHTTACSEQPQPPAAPGSEQRSMHDSTRRPRGRLTRATDAPMTTPAQHIAARESAAGDNSVKSRLDHNHEALLPLEAPDENDPYVDDMADTASNGQYRQRETGLRMPLFDGGDWAGFMSQFEACTEYYKWNEKTKAIRLYTSITGDARKSLGSARAGSWPYARLKRHLEVRYGKIKPFAQIQEELFARKRGSNQSLYAFHDEIIAAADTANIPDEQREQLIYTAFVYGLRSNRHMHRWVSRRDTIGTIESALELAEAYEDEYGPTSVLQSLPVSVNARDSTGNALAVAIPSAASTKTVSVDAAVPDQGDLSLTTQMQAGFKNIEKQITQQFATIDTRLGAVEKYQGEQIRRWENRRSKNQQRRDGKRAKTWNESRGDRQSSWHSKSEENDRKGKFSDRQGSKKPGQEVNARASAAESGEE